MAFEVNIIGYPLIFWVVVVKNVPLENYCILGGTNRSAMLKRMTAHDTLLYMRPFSDMHAAIGHKLFLEALSTESIERIIRQENPDCIAR